MIIRAFAFGQSYLLEYLTCYYEYIPVTTLCQVAQGTYPQVSQPLPRYLARIRSMVCFLENGESAFPFRQKTGIIWLNHLIMVTEESNKKGLDSLAGNGNEAQGQAQPPALGGSEVITKERPDESRSADTANEVSHFEHAERGKYAMDGQTTGKYDIVNANGLAADCLQDGLLLLVQL